MLVCNMPATYVIHCYGLFQSQMRTDPYCHVCRNICLDYLQISYFWIMWPFQQLEPLGQTLLTPSSVSVNTFKLTNQMRRNRSCLGEYKKQYKIPIWRDPVTISVKYLILKVQSITMLPTDLKPAPCFICAIPRFPENQMTWVNTLDMLTRPVLDTHHKVVAKWQLWFVYL